MRHHEIDRGVAMRREPRSSEALRRATNGVLRRGCAGAPVPLAPRRRAAFGGLPARFRSTAGDDALLALSS